MEEDIKRALDINDIEEARRLIKIALQSNSSADIYYYAALVAVSTNQKKGWLEKALELDPFHPMAAAELEKTQLPVLPTLTQSTSAQLPVAKPPKKTTPFILGGLILVLIAAVAIIGVVVSGNISTQNSNSTASAEAEARNNVAAATVEARNISATATAAAPKLIAAKYDCLPEIISKDTKGSYFDACVTPQNSGQYTKVTAYARILADGVPKSGIPITFYFNYLFFPEKHSVTTNSQGIAQLVVNTGMVTVGKPVLVDVYVTDGQSILLEYSPSHGETTFTPK